MVLAYGINKEFFRHLRKFMKKEYVKCDCDIMACAISDKTRYNGPGEFIPIVLSIK